MTTSPQRLPLMPVGTGIISISIFLSCQKLLNGAMPVPAPTIIIGNVLSSGKRKLGALLN
jgi:hypothetical protein